MTELKVNDFEVNGGQTIDDRGKAHWPDCLNICMDKHHAWDLLYSLVAQLRDTKTDKVDYAFMGKLNYDVEE